MPENSEKLRKKLKKPIDKPEKMRYNLNEPNGSKRKTQEKGGQNEVKEYQLLLSDSELRKQVLRRYWPLALY